MAERVRAGLRNARAKGKHLGRPRVLVDAARIATLRAHGRSWREVCAELGLSKGTAQCAIACPKTLPCPKTRWRHHGNSLIFCAAQNLKLACPK